MTASELAAEYAVTAQTVRRWVRAGLPIKKNGPRGRLEFDGRAARSWVRTHADLTGRARQGGKRRGAGRKKKGNRKSEPRQATGDTGRNPEQEAAGSARVPGSVAEIDRLAESGLLTVGGLGLAEAAVKVRRLLREEAIAAAAVLPVKDVTEAWTSGLARLGVALERLTARISGRLAEVGLPAHQRHAAGAMIDEEVARCRVEMITAYRERLHESSGRTAGDDRDQGADSAPAAIRE